MGHANSIQNQDSIFQEVIEDFKKRLELLNEDPEESEITTFTEITITKEQMAVIAGPLCGLPENEFTEYYRGKIHGNLLLSSSEFTYREDQPDFQYLFDLGVQALMTGMELGFKKSIIQLEKERLEWSLKTFPEATAISSLRKLESEIEEIEVDIIEGNKEPMEYADALMCLFDSAGRQGITIEQIFEDFEKKLEINKNRAWKKNADNSYSHIK